MATPEAMAAAAAEIDALPRRVVFYHHPCADGVFAALAAYAHAKARRPHAEPPRFVPLRVYEEPPDPASLGLSRADTGVFFLDFTGPPHYARKVAQHAALCVPSPCYLSPFLSARALLDAPHALPPTRVQPRTATPHHHAFNKDQNAHQPPPPTQPNTTQTQHIAS